MRVNRQKLVDDNNNKPFVPEVDRIKPAAPKANYDVFSSEPQERAVIRMLIKFGNEEGVFIIDTEEGPTKITMKIADFIIQSMKEDEFVFDNEIYRRMYEDCCAFADKEFPINEDYFLRHEDSTISQTSMELLMESYTLSNWKGAKNVDVKTERNDIGRAAMQEMDALKSKKIERMDREIKERIKNALTEEELKDALEGKQRLDSAKVTFKKRMGRVF